MKKIWTSDPKEILTLFSGLVDTAATVTLQLNSNWGMRTRLLKFHYHKGWPYLLLRRPAELESGGHIKSLLFKMKGFPILGCSCTVERETENILALGIPDHVFLFELRRNPRINPLRGSIATFFLKDKARVSICSMENISMGGCKLVGRPTHQIQSDDIVGPCTLSLAGRDALISREVTIDTATIVRLDGGDGTVGQIGVGLQFDLSDSEKRQLHEHIAFISDMSHITPVIM